MPNQSACRLIMVGVFRMTTAKIWDYPSDIDQKDNPFLLRGDYLYCRAKTMCY